MRIPLVFLLLPLCATALSGCATPEPAPHDTGRIDGSLLDQFMEPYGNASVRLVELDLVEETTRLGGFSFVDVPEGVYTLEAQPPQAQRTSQQVVLDDERAVVILQARRDVPDPVYKAALARDAKMLVGLPGQECTECAWTTRLTAPPDEIVLRADWDEAFGSPLVVELWDEDGSLVRRIEATPPVWEPIGKEEVQGPHLTVRVRLGDDPAPRADLRVHTGLDVYYGADRAEQD